ncbi:hypothetical protein ACFV4I_04100 [Nocardiopsis alba]|uniref:hypothetical protein n=1 Tax=Nocardiopsis alba TaxID=53437 RepID=UPI003647448D
MLRARTKALALAAFTAVLAFGAVPASAGTAVPSAENTPAASTTTPMAQADVPASFREDGVRIRRSYDGSSEVLGLGYRNHSVSAFCVIFPDPMVTFYGVQNHTTGVRGYAFGDYVLVDDISALPSC